MSLRQGKKLIETGRDLAKRGESERRQRYRLSILYGIYRERLLFCARFVQNKVYKTEHVCYNGRKRKARWHACRKEPYALRDIDRLAQSI